MNIGFGIFLMVLGAIMNFALDTRIRGVNVDMIGWILMAAGLAIFTLGFIRRQPRTVTQVDATAVPVAGAVPTVPQQRTTTTYRDDVI